jgi:hypothetical protein
VVDLMRIGWRSIGGIVARVWADVQAGTDLLAGLRRIGIDEISYRKGHKYLLVVVDHDTGRLVWATKRADQASLSRFFDLLGPTRCAQVSHISSDSAGWMNEVIAVYCPRAVRCETRRRVKVIGRLPGETSCVSLVWAVLDRASRGWRGFTVTAAGTRLLQDLRRQLLDPPTPIRRHAKQIRQPAADAA